MGHIGDPIVTAVPSPGAKPWVSTVNTLLQEYKDRLSEAVRSGSIEWNSDVDLNGGAVLNAEYLTLTSMTGAPTTPVGQLAYSGGEFYLVTGAGTVQVTSGGNLNASAIGGIGGDYGGVNPASFQYDSTGSRYIAFKDPAGPTYADVLMKRLQLVSTVDLTSVVTLSTVATEVYPVVLPAALPGGVALLSFDSSGVLATDATVDTELTMAADLVFSGASRVQHAARAIYVSLTTVRAVTGTVTYAGKVTSGAPGEYHVAFSPHEGNRLTGFQVKGQRVGTTAGPLAVSLCYTSGGAETVLVTATSPGGIGAWTTLTSSGISHEVAGDRSYYLKLVTTVNTNSEVHSISVFADRT